MRALGVTVELGYPWFRFALGHSPYPRINFPLDSQTSSEHFSMNTRSTSSPQLARRLKTWRSFNWLSSPSSSESTVWTLAQWAACHVPSKRTLPCFRSESKATSSRPVSSLNQYLDCCTFRELQFSKPPSTSQVMEVESQGKASFTNQNSTLLTSPLLL